MRSCRQHYKVVVRDRLLPMEALLLEKSHTLGKPSLNRSWIAWGAEPRCDRPLDNFAPSKLGQSTADVARRWLL